MTNSRFIAWTIWMIGSIFYAYQYILRVMPNVMLEDIITKFNIDTTVFGQFTGFYYIGYSLLHLPIGIMLDRFGPKKVMSGCILLTVLGLTPLLFSTHILYPIIGRIMIGIGSSAAILGLFKIIRLTFPEDRFARMLSFAVMIGLIGAIYGGGPVSYMSDILGMEDVVKIFIALGLALSVITYLIVPDIKEETSDNTSILKDIKEVLTNKKMLLSCIFAGFMVGPIEGFADVWGSAFLKQVYNIDNNIAASMPSAIFIGMCFGAPVLNFIAERTNYLGTIIGSGIVMTICFSGLILKLFNVELISASFIIIGVCCAYQILAIYQASTYVNERVVGLATAIANMIIMSFGYAFHSVIGLVISLNGGAHSVDAFVNGVAIIPITLLIGSLGFILISCSLKKKS